MQLPPFQVHEMSLALVVDLVHCFLLHALKAIQFDNLAGMLLQAVAQGVKPESSWMQRQTSHTFPCVVHVA